MSGECDDSRRHPGGAVVASAAMERESAPARNRPRRSCRVHAPGGSDAPGGARCRCRRDRVVCAVQRTVTSAGGRRTAGTGVRSRRRSGRSVDPQPLAESSSSPGPALARWEVDGVEHIGRVGLEARGRAGETVRIWVDETGDYMPVPRTGIENALAALGAALAILVLGTVACALTLFGVHVEMNRQRLSRWDRKWQEAGRLPGWPIG